MKPAETRWDYVIFVYVYCCQALAGTGISKEKRTTQVLIHPEPCSSSSSTPSSPSSPSSTTSTATPSMFLDYSKRSDENHHVEVLAIVSIDFQFPCFVDALMRAARVYCKHLLRLLVNQLEIVGREYRRARSADAHMCRALPSEWLPTECDFVPRWH